MTHSFKHGDMAVQTCKNCGEKIERKFCTHCGQNIHEGRIGIRALLHDIPHAIFHVDSGFFYNTIQLFKRPGFAIMDYLQGRRKPFFHPVTYLAILLVLNLMAVKVTNLHYYDEKELLTMSPDEIAFIKAYDASQWWFLEHTYLYMLIAIPVCALFCFFFFRAFKRRFNFAENAVIVMFTIAQGVLIQTILYFLFGWVKSGPFIRGMEVVNLILMAGYATYAFYQVINPQKKKLWIGMASFFGGIMALSIMLASAYLLLEISKLL